MSPRRSSRARTTQPPPTAPQHTTSSNSSGSNSIPRAERSARSNQKIQSPQTSSTQRSESLDNPELVGRGDGPATRRSKRNDAETEEAIKTNVEELGFDEVDGEEITRCICTNPEYPGPPSFVRDSAYRNSTRPIVKEEQTQNGTLDGLTDDSGNFFIQCDSCQVWQHGGCVGLMDESMSPDEYFCEECKPELHKIHIGPNGAKSSFYRPVVHVSTPSSSSSSSRGDSQKPDSKLRASAAAVSTKRRATMNSRDAAYDEEEILKRVLEESKETSGSLGKRAREDGTESRQTSKRQRLSSEPPTSRSKHSRSPSLQPSDNEIQSPDLLKTGNNSRKARATAARTNHEKEMKERQTEREKQRIEQASRRNARSERRRAEDSPPPTPSLSPTKAGNPASQSSQKANEVDSPSHRPNANHKKTGRPPTKRGRLGRNQYTRDLPLHSDDDPLRDRSRDGQGNHGSPTNGVNGNHTENGRPSRPRQHPIRTSMNEMKRRVAAILEFVNRVRVDPSGPSSSDGSTSTPNGLGQNVPNSSAMVQEIIVGLSGQIAASDDSEKRKEFRDMDSKEMMVHLCQDLKNWQTLHGKYGEK